jgi:UDP-N-acetylmuramyl pentapeptide phosphotransferase/UDP-N-acetylglucosamine-1-phosphate transferase
MSMSLAVLGVAGFLAAYFGVGAFRGWAEQRLLDIPNARSSHKRPTPRGGGLMIVLVTLAGLLVYALLEQGLSWRELGAYVLGGVLVASFGWLDDLRSLSSGVRLGVQSIAACIVIAGFGYWQQVALPGAGVLTLGVLGLPLSFLWIVGLTNAYNFMDGIDGIAGSQAVVAGLGWALVGTWYALALPVAMGVLIAASALGFLLHNWPPARIFMGDVGSAFLGYSFAVLALTAARVEPLLPLAGALLLWPFLFDTVFTFLRRLRRRENVFAAHRSHLYQRAIIAGHSHRFVTLLYSVLAAIGAGMTAVWLTGEPALQVGTSALVALLCGGLWLYVLRLEQRQEAELRPQFQVDEQI